MYGVCLEVVCKVFGMCMECVWKVSVMFQKVSGRCLKGFMYLIFLANLFFLCKIFLDANSYLDLEYFHV